MATNTAGIAKGSAKRAAQEARRAAMNPVFEALERYGYVARGVIYFIIGILAVQVAIGAGGKTTDPNGAVATIGAQPAGHLLLTLVALGLFGYSLWGLVRAVWDPLGRGKGFKGIVQRIGYLVSAFSYGTLMIATAQYVLGKSGPKPTGSPAVVSGQLFSQPNGHWLVIAFGAFWVLAALGQFYVAYKAEFAKDFRTSTMSVREFDFAQALGRFGYASRGVVFGLIGWFVVDAGLTMNPQKAVGYDGALLKLAQGPNGTLLLGIVAVGLMAFGIFSALCSKWVKVERMKG